MVLEMATDVEEKKPDRPPAKTTNIYPMLNKYSEKTASVKELTTSKISLHKENTISKETSTQSTVTHTNKNESEKLIHSETVTDGTIDGQIKKPPVPLKKSPTPASSVTSLLSGLKNKMMPSSDKEKEKSSSTTVSSGSSSGGEWDRPDGATASKPTNNTNSANSATNTFDHIERNSILNDPRAARVKAPRRRPPSQALRDDTAQQIGLSNGHEADKPAADNPTSEKTEKGDKSDKGEEIKPRAREWEKHRAPWMEELKLNQAKKTGLADARPRASLPADARPATTDRIIDCALDEKRSTHSMEMSKSTSSITGRMTVLESFEETKVRHSLDSKKEVTPATRDVEPPAVKPVQSPTAAGRTLISMLDEVKKPPAPAPPTITPLSTTITPPNLSPASLDKSPNSKPDKTMIKTDKTEVNSINSVSKMSSSIFEKTSTLERVEKEEKLPERPPSVLSGEKIASGTLERRVPVKTEKSEGTDALIAQLNNRISNLEKLIEVQNSVFQSALEELKGKLKQEAEVRAALQAQVERLAHCLTHV